MKTSGPPRLLVKTLTATFLTVFALLAIVFGLTTMRARDELRRSVTETLESSQRLFAVLEQRRQQAWRAQAANLAESPTLKAAIDTYAAELHGSDDATRTQLLATIQAELDRVARLSASEVDAIVLLDARQHTLASAGRLARDWPQGQRVDVGARGGGAGTFDGIVRADGHVFRAATVPLVLGDGATIGTLYAATRLDREYADGMKRLSRSDVAIASDGVLLASTLADDRSRAFESALRRINAPAGTAALGNESFAYQALATVGDTTFYALASIDQSSRLALKAVWWDLGAMAVGATCLALLGSVWLAHQLSGPIGRLSTSLEAKAASRDLGAMLVPAGSSEELNTLTDTFNRLMASVATAETQTEAAYSGAIQALATALDARDRYTAGHSERVSVLSVAIARKLGLPDSDIDVIRLGALLHDIGKIGVPDDILRKPGPLTPAEFDAIKQHPVHGARILRSVPFLAEHLSIVELHHEQPDGLGYPRGLRGHDTPLIARVVHVADAYDAITSARAYRGALSSAEALHTLWHGAGTKFDAEIVGALVATLPETRAAANAVEEALAS